MPSPRNSSVQNFCRIRSCKILQCLKTLKLIDRLSDFPSDDEAADVTTDRTLRLFSKVKHKKNVFSSDRSANNRPRSSLLEFIPPPLRLQDHSNPFETYSDCVFAERYIFDKHTTLFILKIIEYGLVSSSNRGYPVAPITQLLITLRFLATGKHFQLQLE